MFQGIFDLDVTRFSNSSEKIMSPPVRRGGRHKLNGGKCQMQKEPGSGMLHHKYSTIIVIN